MSDTRLISRSPVELLRREHELLSNLFAAYEEFAPEQVREKAQIVRRIDEEIARHIGTQEALFYPTLLELKDPGIHELVGEAMAEHRMLEARAGDLRRARPGTETELSIDILKTLVQRHLAYEQAEVLPLASRLGRVTLNQLGLEIEERWMKEDGY